MKSFLKISLFLFIVACSKTNDSVDTPTDQLQCPFNDLSLSSNSSDENITITASTTGPNRAVGISVYLKNKLVSSNTGLTKITQNVSVLDYTNYPSAYNYTFYTPSPNTEYKFVVTLSCKENNSLSIRDSILISTKSKCTLSNISNLQVEENSSDEIKVFWDYVTYASGYNVYVEDRLVSTTPISSIILKKPLIPQQIKIVPYCESYTESKSSSASILYTPKFSGVIYISNDTVPSAKYSCIQADCKQIKSKYSIPNFYEVPKKYLYEDCKSFSVSFRNYVYNPINSMPMISDYSDLTLHLVKEASGYKVYYKSKICPEAKNWKIFNNTMYFQYPNGTRSSIEFFENDFVIHATKYQTYTTTYDE